MDRQQEFVLRTLEEREIRFVRLWFTDVLGYLKAVAVAPAEIEAAFAEGIGFDGSAIEGFARVFESDMIAKPDPGTFQVHARRQEAAQRHGADVLRHHACPTGRRPGPTRGTCCAGRWPRPRTWASPSTPTPRSSSSCSRTCPTTGATPRPADNGGYFDLSTHDVAHDFRREAVFALEAHGHLGRVQPPRGRPGPAGDRPALRRRAVDGRQRHDVAARRPGGRAGRRACTRRSCPSRSPSWPARRCTPTCRCSRATATPSTTRPTSPYGCRRPRKRSSPACSSTPARRPPSPTRR